MSSQASTSELENIVPPLINLLNDRFPTDDFYEYEIAMLGQIGEPEPCAEQVSIELPDDITSHEPAMRAVATLLMKSGSVLVWGEGKTATGDSFSDPLRFHLVKRMAWAGHFWSWARYLVIDGGGDAIDGEAAARQTDLLVKWLSDPANLVELTPEMRELF